MKEMKILSGMLAAALSASVILSIPAAAEEAVEMPAAIDTSITSEEILIEALEHSNSFIQTQYSCLLEDDSYTLSAPYFNYNFHTCEWGENQQYIIFVQKDGVYIEELLISATQEDGIGTCNISDKVLEYLESEEEFWLGWTEYYLPYEMVYTVEDGFSCLNFKKELDYTWGNVPYVEYKNDMDHDDVYVPATEPVTTTELNVQKVNGSYYGGDINLDGKIDLSDAVLSSQAVSGAVQLNEQQILTADCDANGVIDANDTIVLLQFLVHKLDTLPYTNTGE